MSTPSRPAESVSRRHDANEQGSGILFHYLGRYGLVILLVLTLVVFSLAQPAAFATWDNLKFTLDAQSVVIIGALAAMIPLLTDSIDLSVAANISLANILMAVQTSNEGRATGLAMVIAIAASAVVGLINGLVVVRLQVESFVATLGMATVLLGVGLAYSNATDVVSVPEDVTGLVRTEVLGLPLSVYYAIVLMVIVAFVLRFLPVGRKLRAVGANSRAAALTGIRPGRYRVVSFVVSGFLAGIGGVVFTGQLGAATSSGAANTLLLPIFAALFLGSTAFTPGRPNVLGLFIAAVFLAFVSSGLVLLGAPLWLTPLINGSVLILAVALSSWATRLRARQFRTQQLKQLQGDDHDGAAVSDLAAPHVEQSTPSRASHE